METRKSINDIQTNIAINIDALQQRVNSISANIDVLNRESAEYSTIISVIRENIRTLETHVSNVQSIEQTLSSIKETINKLETSFDKHITVTTDTYISIKKELEEVKCEVDKIPLIYEQKTHRSWNDILKSAPAIITIIGSLLGVLVLYLKNVIGI